MRKNTYILLLLLVMIGCSEKNKPSNNQSIGETEFDKAYVHPYGSYYLNRGIDKNVFDLDIYSAKIDLDSTGKIVGTGSNLYLSDIFLPMDINQLAEGQYQSDTICSAYTFLPGVNYDGNISGAYLLQIVDGNLSSYTVFDEGSFVLEQQENDTVQISFLLYYMQSGIKRKYEATMKGVLQSR